VSGYGLCGQCGNTCSKQVSFVCHLLLSCPIDTEDTEYLAACCGTCYEFSNSEQK